LILPSPEAAIKPFVSSIIYDDDDDGDYCEAPILVEDDSGDESDSDDEGEHLSDEELADLLAEEGGHAHLSSTGMMDVSE